MSKGRWRRFAVSKCLAGLSSRSEDLLPRRRIPLLLAGWFQLATKPASARTHHCPREFKRPLKPPIERDPMRTLSFYPCTVRHRVAVRLSPLRSAKIFISLRAGSVVARMTGPEGKTAHP